MGRACKLVVLLALTLTVLVVVSPSSGGALPPGYVPVHRQNLVKAVDHTRLLLHQPRRVVDVARIARGAPVHLKAVVSNERVLEDDPARRLELTSSMCRRAGGVLCVNGDFSLCHGCGEPFGGMVIDGALVRTPHRHHQQLSLTDQGLVAQDWDWSGSLVATYETRKASDPTLPVAEPAVRTETRELRLDSVNAWRVSNQLTLFTRYWGGTTQTTGGTEMVLRVGGRLMIGADVPARPVAMREGGGTTIPPDSVVLSGHGRGRDRLRAFWHEFVHSRADAKRLSLRVTTSLPIRQSLGGHPVALRGGKVVQQPAQDRMAHQRHPRTLVGWKPGGDVWLMTIDGRQPGFSDGASVAEAAELLRLLGATEAINLDGGGSTTFVASAPCPGGPPCVLNRPSDGRERRVTSALAVVLNRVPPPKPTIAGQKASRVAPPAALPPRPDPPAAAAEQPGSQDAAPVPPPPPPAGPDPASVAPTGEVPRQPPPALPPSRPAATAPELAAPAPSPRESSTGRHDPGPAVLAGLLLTAVGGGAVVVARSRRSARRTG